MRQTFYYCNENGLLDKKNEKLKDMELPFKIDGLPVNFSSPNELILKWEQIEKHYNSAVMGQ